MNTRQPFQTNGTLALIGFLAFIVLSSKNIIIYNEELLIGLSFAAFVAFTTITMGGNIHEMLTLRQETIHRELQRYLEVREALLQDLVQEYKRNLVLENSLSYLRDQSCGELKHLHKQREKGLRASFVSQLRNRLHLLEQTENQGHDKVQQGWQYGFRYGVLEMFQRTKKVIGPKLIQQALRQLRQTNP